MPIASESNPDSENEISLDDDVEVPEEPDQDIRDNRAPIAG